MFTICVEVVEGRKKLIPNLDTTKILNELLANDKWLEQVRMSRKLALVYNYFRALLFNMKSTKTTKKCSGITLFYFSAIQTYARYLGRR